MSAKYPGQIPIIIKALKIPVLFLFGGIANLFFQEAGVNMWQNFLVGGLMCLGFALTIQQGERAAKSPKQYQPYVLRCELCEEEIINHRSSRLPRKKFCDGCVNTMKTFKAILLEEKGE